MTLFCYYEDTMKRKNIILPGTAVCLAVLGILISFFSPKKKEHQYFCDKYTLNVDDIQIDLLELEPDLSSVSELLMIDPEHLFILGRMDESENLMLIYDFQSAEIIFQGYGTTMCWTNDDYRTARYLKDDVVYDLEGQAVYRPDKNSHVYSIEYVKKYLKIVVSNGDYSEFSEVWF